MLPKTKIAGLRESGGTSEQTPTVEYFLMGDLETRGLVDAMFPPEPPI